jgi:hypothetical protein
MARAVPLAMKLAAPLALAGVLLAAPAVRGEETLACPASPPVGASQEEAEAAARTVCDALRALGAHGAYEISLEVDSDGTHVGASDPWGRRVVYGLGSVDVASAAPTIARGVMRSTPSPAVSLGRRGGTASCTPFADGNS